MLKSWDSKQGRSRRVLSMVPLPTWELSTKSHLVRWEMVHALPGAEQRDVGAMESAQRGWMQEAAALKSDGLVRVGWWENAEGEVDSGREWWATVADFSVVSGHAVRTCLARSPKLIEPLELLVYARGSNVSHNQPQHQLFKPKILRQSHLPSIAFEAKLAAQQSGSEPSRLFCLGLHSGPSFLHQTRIDSRASTSGRRGFSYHPKGDHFDGRS